MKIPVVITKDPFEKGKKIFSEAADFIQWTVVSDEENTAARAIDSEKARVAVLGTAPYSFDIYTALSRNSRRHSSLIARFGVGYDGIDMDMCRKHNIILTITPGALDESVAEHALAMILNLSRHISKLDREMHADLYQPSTGIELYGKQLGILGLGRIGKRLAVMASQGLNMKIVACDILTVGEQAGNENRPPEDFKTRYGIDEYYTDFDLFARRVNMLSIHIPLNESTYHFFDSRRLSRLNPDSFLINTSRGAIFDEAALYDALESGRLKAAALDVFSTEPYTPQSASRDLRKLPQVLLTPHVGSNTEEANANMARRVLKNIDHFSKEEFTSMDAVPSES